MNENLKRPHGLIWCLLGLVSGALGWSAGALAGSILARTVLATMLIAVALGLLARRPRLALIGGAATAAAAALTGVSSRLSGMHPPEGPPMRTLWTRPWPFSEV